MNRPHTAKVGGAKTGQLNEAGDENVSSNIQRSNPINIGETFKALRPEVQTTLDKIFQQVEIVSGTLSLLEKRVAYSEDRMFDVLNYIKDHDVGIRPKLVPNYPMFTPQLGSHPNLFSDGPSGETVEQGYILRPHVNNLNLQGVATSESQMSPQADFRIAEALRSNAGGDEFFRTTNVFSMGKF